MDAKAKRKVLNEYSEAHRDIELTEVAIGILERVTGSGGVVATLKKKQQAHLRRIDKAAEKLGSPYGANAQAQGEAQGSSRLSPGATGSTPATN